MPSLYRTLLLLLLVATLTNPGCSCRQETPQERAARIAREEEERLKRIEEEKKRQKEKQKKPPVERTGPPLPQPNQTDRPATLVKAGHWMSVSQATKANYKDWVGVAQQQIVGKGDRPTPIERTAFALRTSRNAAVAKGQTKLLETLVFPPNSNESRRLRTSLLNRGGGYADPPASLGMQRMMAHQYHFVVLAAEPERYGFLRNGSYSVDAPIAWNIDVQDETSGGMPPSRNYRVVAPAVDERLALPDNPLCWTTTAYVLWDEVDPERLTAEQRDAMIDWLHWGGQLIVSGPDSLDLLGESFLEPYLPADSLGPRKFTAADLAEVTLAYRASRRPTGTLAEGAEWSGVRLKLRPEAQPVPEAKEVFAERRVGRGRVIVSAVQLAERGLLNWSGGFESLFNALVLRRPPRRFVRSNVNFDGRESEVFVRAADRNEPQLDAAANTRVRFFARDTHKDRDALRYRPLNPADRDRLVASGRFSNWDLQNGLGGDTITYVAGGRPGGAAAWNDFNAAASAARESLREAAGVKVPQRGFVLNCLAVYLIVIGPVNWVFFKALGRVELAWVAAPVITAIGTVAVVRLAELDIGFARAQTEIAILETQPGCPRAHLTRYTAVYSSLSTTYEFKSEEPTTLIAPFADSETFEMLRGQSLTQVTFERQEKVRLRGFAVSSADTDMAHTEQMVSLDNGLRYDPATRLLTNGTRRDLGSLAVVRRDTPRGSPPKRGSAPPATVSGCWVGSLPAGESTTVTFAPLSAGPDAPAFAAERAAEGAPAANEERLNLEPLFGLALDPEQIGAGEVRAVARIDETLPGLDVTPSAAQVAGATLVVAHLEYPPLPAPVGDANAPIDVAPE